VRKRARVTIRQAQADDAPEAGPLVFEAAPILFALLFGPQKAEAVRALTQLFKLGGNPFGFEQAWVAVQGGSVVGVMIAATVEARRRGGRRMWWLLPRVRGAVAMLRRLPEALAMMRGYASPPAEAFYVGILAVAEGCRGQGIGSRLLDEAAGQARNARCSLTVLHVELDHEDALRFYQRAGFREAARHEAAPRLVRQGIAGFVTMERLTTLPELGEEED